jgi:L-threonylcarbamoyladenylate synthase
MACQLIKIHSQKPEKEILQKAAKIIREGGLVAFPTETVYGLGGNSLDKKAVRKIFEVKRRPLDNPVIVHIAKIEDLDLLSKNIPKEAEILAKKILARTFNFGSFQKENRAR